MGIVSSRPEDGAPLLVRDQNRLTITSLKITDSKNRVLYSLLPNTFPATRYTVRKEADDEGIIEYVQDPESSGPGAAPNFLLRLNNDEDLYFYFVFAMRPPPPPANPSSDLPSDTNINSLTFVFAPTMKELDALITREFHADPNLHKNRNVDLVGDYSTAGQQQEQFEWSWKWRPPKPNEDKGGGWRTSCSFVEYDQRAHRLNTLVSFSFWVNNNVARRPSSPKSPDTLLRSDSLAPPRIRLPSSRSIESRMSDSDTDVKDARDTPQPIETIPEAVHALDPTLSSGTFKVDLNCANLDGDISNADDGPLFRATIKSLESKTGSVRQRMKKVLKKAEAARESQTTCNQAVAAFTEALHEAATSNANAVQPALEHYFEKIAKEILHYERQNAENLQRLIIEPLSRIYGNDIKQADAKKKDFEDESRDYYAFVSRYLGQRQDSMKEKKRAESDTKYENKRKTFELKRFDYSSFMQDLHGGRKDQEVLSQLTKYADAQAKGYLTTARKIEGLLPQLDALSYEVREADKQYELMKTGREEKRRTLEKSGKSTSEADPSAAAGPAQAFSTTTGPTQRTFASPPSDGEAALSTSATSSSNLAERTMTGSTLGHNSLPQSPGQPEAGLVSPPRPTTSVVTTTNSPGVDRFKGIRDLESNTEARVVAGQGKEGLLWSMSRPGSHADPRGLNKQAWHKFWVVLDQGRLSEYINWKSNPEQHMDPIDLRVASVREARNAERRFCFEVITPHFTRVYQATGEDDMRTWIQAINNALQGAFEGKSAAVDVPTGSKFGGIAQNLFGKSSSYHGHRSASSTAYLGAKNVNRHSTTGDRSLPQARAHSEERPARLLQSIREADAGNAWCADCNSEVRVEWVSINLGIIICIECSGIHRSLGTHISKVRSLTLDTNAFTQDITELILSLGNRVSNMVWEARLDRSVKPGPNAPREQRLAFITAKYQQRAYVEPLSAGLSHFASPDETLLASIKKNDIKGVYYGLALSANANAADRSRSTHAVFLALAAADPAAPAATVQAPTGPGAQATSADGSQPRKSFPIAELLVQNGAEIPEQAAPIPLSRSALSYVDFKRAQKLGRLASPNGAGGQAGATAGSRDGEMQKREKSLKRSSTGNNVARFAQKAGVI